MSYARAVGRLALALWSAAAFSLIAAQIQERRQPPASDASPDQRVVAACRRLLGPESTLGIAYSDSSAAQVFVAYRLAYEMYPKVVAAVAYDDGIVDGDVTGAVAQVRLRHPDHVLVLAPSDSPLPTLILVARLAPDARLYRSAPDPP